jgi:glycosyltransferase involved in cell wall biosynthesis
LHIGTLNPRKNLSFLIEVFSKVRQNIPNIQLVITGKKGWYYENLFEMVDKLGLHKDVIFTGYIEDQEAPILYSAATIYAFPSLYEGFGLPPLEAMSCGTPIVASNTSSIPEVVGDAGVLLSPIDKIGWSKALQKVLSSTAEQKKMSNQSLERAKNFSWRKTAEKTISIYEEILK